MRALLMTVLVAAATALATGCKDDGVPPVYPVTKTITNWEGKEIDVVIVGRGHEEIYFTKPGSTERISYPIGKLSEKDREFVNKLPRREYYAETPWIKSKREDLRRLEAKIASHKDEIEKSGSKSVRQRAFKRELKKLEAEKLALEKSIVADQKAGR